LEHGFDQANKVKELLFRQGFQEVSSHRDLTGKERITEGRIP
jgi:release factor glutamine methyltransferase